MIPTLREYQFNVRTYLDIHVEREVISCRSAAAVTRRLEPLRIRRRQKVNAHVDAGDYFGSADD